MKATVGPSAVAPHWALSIERQYCCCRAGTVVDSGRSIVANVETAEVDAERFVWSHVLLMRTMIPAK